MYGPEAESEIGLAQRTIPRIPTPSVLLADRNFGVYSFVYHAAQAGHDCITRLTEYRFRAMHKNAQPRRLDAGLETDEGQPQNQPRPPLRRRPLHPAASVRGTLRPDLVDTGSDLTRVEASRNGGTTTGSRFG